MRFPTSTRHLSVLCAGFLASTVVYSGMLGPYLTYAGEPPAEQFSKLFLLPIAATAILLIVGNLRGPAVSVADKAANAALDGILLFVVVFLIGVHGVLLGVLMRVSWIELLAPHLVAVLLGATLIGIGNLLPLTRPNHALGIRTARTLADRQLWIVTHRLAGYVAVAAGVTTIGGGLLSDAPHVIMVVGVTGMVGGVLTLAAYVASVLARRNVGRI